jgi:hypothetical protein
LIELNQRPENKQKAAPADVSIEADGVRATETETLKKDEEKKQQTAFK